LVPLKIVSNVSRFKPALNLNRGSNSLNSISGYRLLMCLIICFTLEARGNDDVKKVRVENEIIYKNPRLGKHLIKIAILNFVIYGHSKVMT